MATEFRGVASNQAIAPSRQDKVESSSVQAEQVYHQQAQSQSLKLEQQQQATKQSNQQTQELSREQLEKMAQKLQDFVGSLNRGLEFSVDQDSGRDVIKVIDRNSGETVRQYPSEEVLDLVASLSDTAGTFVNTKA
ncbi:MAG: flagellar protein FlaG [Gammaproteobacteria bacterium]|nr:flagellar protein FlaG [Gammaproteobacteria bacterium]